MPPIPSRPSVVDRWRPPPFQDGVPPFPDFEWNLGEGIPDRLRDWFRTTVGPLANWYTQNRQFNVGPLENWARPAMDAVRNAHLPHPLMQLLFDRGVEEFQGAGVRDPRQWSRDGDAYRLWTQFLGMDRPRFIGPPAMVQPNPQVPMPPNQPPPAAPVSDWPGVTQLGTLTGQVMQGGLRQGLAPGAGGPPPTPLPGVGPPTWADPSRFDWLRNLRPPSGAPGPIGNPAGSF